MANINQKRGPTTGNMGTPSKVAQFHTKHSSAQTLATAVVNHFTKPAANFTGNMEKQAPVSLPKTTGKK
jgi:phosphoribosylamine-glycine ligase